MKRLSVVTAMILTFGAIVAQAQTCSVDPVTGNAVAQMITPVNGSTLPAGTVTFEWCNANADYFLIVESVPGAHDIFNAFVGGVGPGAGFVSVTLGPACLPAPPTGCIPSLGEPIYVTLWTVKGKQILAPSPFSYFYTAASSTPAPPAATTTTVTNQGATASGSAQTVTLTATVAGGTIDQGTVTFQVVDGAAINVGAAVTSATVANGSASVSYLLPAGTAANTYAIQASYSGGTNFLPSSGSGTLTVAAAPPVPVVTTTTVDPQSVIFNSGAQNVTLTVSVTAASAVNEGTVAFQLMDGATAIGSPVTSATLSNSGASAVYPLPAALPAAAYTIQAAYSGGTNFQASSSTGTLTVNAAPLPTQTATATTAGNNAVTFSNTLQHVTLTAAVSVPGGIVNQGTAAFQVMDGATSVGTAVPSAPITNNNASVSYALPAGMAAKAYSIQVSYSGGTNFLPSSGSGTLTVAKAASVTTFTSTAAASLRNHATYTPAATSTGDGILTIAASGACSMASGVVTIIANSGTCTVTATESEGANHLSSSATQSITATSSASPADYKLDAVVKTLTIQRGQSGSLQITLTPANGFDGTVSFGCSGLPATVRCQFTPAQVVGTMDGKPVTTTLLVSADQSALSQLHPAARHASLLAFWGLGLGIAGITLTGGLRSRRRKGAKGYLLLLLGCAFLLVLLVACGGGSRAAPQPAPQSFTAVVTASFAGGQPAASATQQVSIQITVTP